MYRENSSKLWRRQKVKSTSAYSEGTRALLGETGVLGGFSHPTSLNFFFSPPVWGAPAVIGQVASRLQAILPFTELMILAWVLVIIFPQIAVWLPNQMIKPLGGG